MYTYNNQGFTLIEIVVSLAIIGTVTVALLAAFPRNTLLAQSANNLTTATYLAQAGIEATLSTAFYSLGTGSVEAKARLAADEESYLYHFQRQTEVTYVDENLNDSEDDTQLKKVATTVFWYNPHNPTEQSYTLTTLYTSNKSTGWGSGPLSFPGATHTGTDCTNASGSLYDTGAGVLCKFAAATCPAGWSQAANWQRYQIGTIDGDNRGCWQTTLPTTFSNQAGVGYSAGDYIGEDATGDLLATTMYVDQGLCTEIENPCVTTHPDKWVGQGVIDGARQCGTSFELSHGAVYELEGPYATNPSAQRIEIGCK